MFISVINKLDVQSFFTISLFHASTCFEHMCSKHVEVSKTSKRYFMFPFVHFLVKYNHCIISLLLILCGLPRLNSCQASLS